ncbi:MAG: acyltransferase [Lachnospiraceae bacterium]|nr:acyltransferase [Lachnospiraceae bacterium]
MKERLGFIDGMKAIAAILVFNIHFLNAYYCGVYTLDPAHFHTKMGVEWWIGATPLNLIYAGKVGARLFLTVSAFLMVWSYERQQRGKTDFGQKQRLAEKGLLLTPLKKYVRLVMPIVVVNLLVCMLMELGCYQNDKAASLAGSQEFFGVYNQFQPKVWEALSEGTFGCFLFGTNRYNGPLWFIQYEFLGCTLIAGLLFLGRRKKPVYRMAAFLILSVLFVRTDYLCMLLAAAAAELCVYGSGRYEDAEAVQNAAGRRRSRVGAADRLWNGLLMVVDKVTANGLCMWICFLGSLFLLTYPSLGRTEGTMYEWLPPKVLFYYNVALPGLLFAVWHLKPVQRVLDRKLFRKFNRFSYSFYLVHFPVLCTVSSAFFVSMYGKCSYHVLTAMTYFLTFLTSLFLAWILEKCVDRPMQGVTRKMMERLG